jgi:hypothetical protein
LGFFIKCKFILFISQASSLDCSIGLDFGFEIGLDFEIDLEDTFLARDQSLVIHHSIEN